ncbi:O-antigen ligase family protein [Alphaproteobacteria bacterium]|nr:O-antigen ligase family protein [Alphaproteobacteria bacterium]
MKDQIIVNMSRKVTEPTIKVMFQAICSGLGDALAAMPSWEKGVHIFWLLGPFILLIERSPADIWLSFLAIAFVIRSILQRDGAWLRVFWVRACFLFLTVCMLSSAISTIPSYAFSEGMAWFRFPLFAMATAFWLGTDTRLLYAMLVSTALGMLLMTGILTAEMFIEGQKGGRLHWPYDDAVSGNYLSKVGLPAFTIMVALAIGAKPRLASIMGGLSLISIIMSVLTGERINFLIRACGGMLAALVWQPNWRRYIILIIIEIFAVAAVFVAMPNVQDRFTITVVNSLPTGPHSDYYRVMGAGLSIVETAPVLGIGPATHRELCPSILGKSEFRCDNHPHNFYIQLLTETGVFGLVTGSLMIVSIIWAAFVGWRKNRDNVVAATAFVVPVGLFFPIQSTGDFFGQWNNIFMWSAIALALAAARTLVPHKPK